MLLELVNATAAQPPIRRGDPPGAGVGGQRHAGRRRLHANGSPTVSKYLSKADPDLRHLFEVTENFSAVSAMCR